MPQLLAKKNCAEAWGIRESWLAKAQDDCANAGSRLGVLSRSCTRALTGSRALFGSSAGCAAVDS